VILKKGRYKYTSFSKWKERAKLFEPNKIVPDVGKVFSWLSIRTVLLVGSVGSLNFIGREQNPEIHRKV
jgi:hypothetical protein